MSERKDRSKPGKRLGTGLLLVCLIIMGSMLWRWVFPHFEPEIVHAATQPANPGGNAAAMAETAASGASEPDLVPIHLVGAVIKPGIYQVARGSYLYQLVEQAGGLAADAAAESINLALRLDSNQQIRLPTRAEIAKDPGLAADLSTMASASPMIDLNQASLDQLDGLPGIGPSTALAILEFRKKNGSFQCVEDLMQIPGIKESRFNAIKDRVIVRTRS